MCETVRCGTFIGYNEVLKIKQCEGNYTREVYEKNKMIPARTQWARTLLDSEPIWIWVIEGTNWTDIVKEVLSMYELEFSDRAFVVFDMPCEELVPVSEVRCEVLGIDRSQGIYPAVTGHIPEKCYIYEPEVFTNEFVTDYISGSDLSCNGSILKPYRAHDTNVLFTHSTEL